MISPASAKKEIRAESYCYLLCIFMKYITLTKEPSSKECLHLHFKCKNLEWKKYAFDLGVGQYCFLGPPTVIENLQNYNTHDKPILFRINGEVKPSTLRLQRDVFFTKN